MLPVLLALVLVLLLVVVVMLQQQPQRPLQQQQQVAHKHHLRVQQQQEQQREGHMDDRQGRVKGLTTRRSQITCAGYLSRRLQLGEERQQRYRRWGRRVAIQKQQQDWGV